MLPQSEKHALVTARLMKNMLSPDYMNSYRPISNLSFKSSRLAGHCESNSHFPVTQSAYRKCHSTETAVTPVINSRLSCSLSAFTPLTIDEEMKLLNTAPNKHCNLDPVPTWLLKEMSDIVVGYQLWLIYVTI